MNNEETMILNNSEETRETKNVNSQKKSNVAQNAAYAAGGFVAGAAMGAASAAYASSPASNEPKIEELAVNAEVQTENVTETATVEVPEPENVLIATDEGIRVAQVNDNATFAEAFADARAQVGAGGTFEWRGNVYNTYTEEEWNNMSASERAEFQSKVDYQSIAGETNEGKPTANQTVDGNHKPESETVTPTDAQFVDDSANEGIKVLGVEAVTDANGNPMTIAAIELEGEQALLVDVDNNGMMDVIVVDENNDGKITENELYDISEGHIATADLQQLEAAQNGDMLYACNDDMPDYMNDADISMMA